jgi:type IV fimbrial biogenesis protein FimT
VLRVSWQQRIFIGVEMIASTCFVASLPVCHPKGRLLAGFGLIELMITLVIASIFLGLALPSFKKLTSDTRLTAYTNDFMTALLQAKSEAVKRDAAVTVLSASGTPGQWEAGWYVYVNASPFTNGGVGNFDLANDSLCLPDQNCLLRVHDPLSGGYTLRTVTGGTSFDMVITYLGNGLTLIAPIQETFTLCDGTHDNTQSRQIAINAIGRARSSSGTGICP